MKTLIIIPARYGSTRLPGKPLLTICGQTLLERVVKLSVAAAEGMNDVSVLVATDDERITRFCDTLGIPSMMTSAAARNGTERVALALENLDDKPDFILNMQGDAPLTPPDFLKALINGFRQSPCDMITPVTQLTWQELDTLRQNKLTTPFSGATAVFDKESGKAFWFSKTILPALRDEKTLRLHSELSPVFRHIGLYGYSRAMLEKYPSLPESTFEKLEGLEQLRLLEQGYTIRCVPVSYQGRANMSGVDSPEDIIRAESLIAHHGELLTTTRQQTESMP